MFRRSKYYSRFAQAAVCLALAFCCLLPAARLQAQFNDMSGMRINEQRWLPGYSIKDVLQDKSGNIWVATNAGLYHYNLNFVRHYDVTKFTQDKYLNNHIYALEKDESDNILIGTQSGLGLFDVQKRNITLLSAKDEDITDILKNGANNFWYITRNGRVYDLKKTDKNGDNDIAGYQRKILFDRKQFDRRFAVKSLIQVDVNQYLIGTSEGLFLLNKSQLYPTTITDAVTSILKENQTIWIATAGSGLLKCNFVNSVLSVADRFQPRDEDGLPLYIQTVGKFNDHAIIAASTNEVYVLDKVKFPDVIQKTNKESDLKFNAINNLMVDKTSNVWIGSRLGLFTLNAAKLKVDFLSLGKWMVNSATLNSIIYLGSDSLLAVSSTSGLVMFNTRTHVSSHLETPFKSVHLVSQASSEKMLVIADDKLFGLQFVQGQPVYGLLGDIGASQRAMNDIEEVFPGDYWITHWSPQIGKS